MVDPFVAIFMSKKYADLIHYNLKVLNYVFKPDWSRVSKSGGYLAVICPDHPRAWSTGYIHVHVLVAESKIGRLLYNGEISHHVDENKMNNHPDNLEVLAGHSAHALEHGKDKHVTMVDLICTECNTGFRRRKGHEPAIRGKINAFCTRRCSGIYQRRMQLINTNN